MPLECCEVSWRYEILRDTNDISREQDKDDINLEL